MKVEEAKAPSFETSISSKKDHNRKHISKHMKFATLIQLERYPWRTTCVIPLSYIIIIKQKQKNWESVLRKSCGSHSRNNNTPTFLYSLIKLFIILEITCLRKISEWNLMKCARKIKQPCLFTSTSALVWQRNNIMVMLNTPASSNNYDNII